MIVMSKIAEIIGFISIFLILTFHLLLILYLYFKVKLKIKSVKPVIRQNDMPCLRPRPIPTKNHSFLVRILVWIFDVRKWELIDDWSFQLRDKTEIFIPKGFIFDGASIPRPLWQFLNPVGLLLIPGLIHDFAYQNDKLLKKKKKGDIVPYKEGSGRKYWDKLFKTVGYQVNGFAVIDYIAWIFVRCFGCFAWNRHKKNRAVDIKS